MSRDRPIALLIYCVLLAVLIVGGAGYGAYSLLKPSTVAPTIADALLAFMPLAILAAGASGMWFMRWWAVGLFWLCVLIMTVTMLFVPSSVADVTPSYLAYAVSVWTAVLALPPTLLAILYRRRFR